jgi:hypothetical protein
MDNFSQYLQNIQNSQGMKEYSQQLQQTALEKIQESNIPYQDIGTALIGESIREVGGALLKNVVSKAGDAIMNTSKGLMRSAMEKAGIDSDTIEQTLQGNLGSAMKGKVSDLLEQAKGKAQGVLEDVQGKAQELLDDASNTVQNTIDTATNQAQSYVNDIQNTATNTIDDLTQRASNISDILQSQQISPQESQLQQTQQQETNQNLSENEPEFEDTTGDLLEQSNKPISSEFISSETADVGADVGASVGADVVGAEAGALAIPGFGEVLGPLIALGAGLGFLFGHKDDSTPASLPFINPSEQFI